ncbi:unnamed protein product [Thlaspi arvense]|uniref:Uncharacterized protein n=1 Tax=Thlaspi arvense TaxID=13288 RepID=A0AAU9SK49_THLAR|nr:unnamed protein product [Thlaspi arvense]
MEMYDLNAGTVDRIGRHDDIATSVVYSCEKGQLVNSSERFNIFLKPFQSYESQVEVPIRCVTSVPYSRGYAVGSVDGQVALDFPNTSCSSEMNGSGTFVTGDNEGYVISWNAKSRRRLFELPRYSNSVASLTYNHTGELLAVASSHTYQEAKEK